MIFAHMRTNDSDLEEDRVRLTGNRYASLSDVDREVQSPRPAVRRRLVLFPNAKLIQRQTTVTSGIQTRRKLMMLWNPQLSKIQSQWDRCARARRSFRQSGCSTFDGQLREPCPSHAICPACDERSHEVSDQRSELLCRRS